MESFEQKDEVCLYAHKISKLYPGTKALDSVDFQVFRGKVNVLIGENGAGKSTLMKILAGVEKPDEGEIVLNGESVKFQSTREAVERGIGIIHQELNLCPNLTIAQNIFLAKENKKYGFLINHQEHRRKTTDILQTLGHPLGSDTFVSDLRVGMQQIVEIAKTMSQDNLKVLIMDEPTSSLSQAEVKSLFSIIHNLTKQGVAIIYISHRMNEIMEIGDFVTILRDGRLVASAKVPDVDLPWIVQNMVGESNTRSNVSYDRQITDEVLRIESLALPRRKEGYILNDVSISVRKGEIIGIFGLLGAGRTELLECLMGLHPEHRSKIYLEGKEIKIRNIATQIAAGFAYIPEDRQREGLIKSLSIAQNIALSSLRAYTVGMHLMKKKLQTSVNMMIKELLIKVKKDSLSVDSLSGGNQQKVVIAKAILTAPKVMLLDEPTRGIDVNAKREVFQLIRKFASQGIGMIVVDSEIKEIIDIADRILVLSKGRVTGIFERHEITEDVLMSAASIGVTD